MSEPMKAAILLAIAALVSGLAIVLAATKIADATLILTSAVKAQTVGSCRGVGGFAGGLFEDRLDLD